MSWTVLAATGHRYELVGGICPSTSTRLCPQPDLWLQGTGVGRRLVGIGSSGGPRLSIIWKGLDRQGRALTRSSPMEPRRLKETGSGF